MKLSIILPCYNEEKNLSMLFEKFANIINRNDIEVIFVNNGSTDNSAEVFKELLAKYNFARLVEIKENQGYGFGVTTGLKSAKGEFIGYTHADLQSDPSDIIKALTILESEQNPKHCYIKGDRKGRSLFDEFFTFGMSIFESMYLKCKLWDINAQPNIFHKSFFEKIKSSCPKDFSLDLYLLYMARQNNLKIIRFDVLFPPRIHGVSSWNTGFKAKWKFIKRTLEFSVKLKKDLK